MSENKSLGITVLDRYLHHGQYEGFIDAIWLNRSFIFAVRYERDDKTKMCQIGKFMKKLSFRIKPNWICLETENRNKGKCLPNFCLYCKRFTKYIIHHSQFANLDRNE